MFGKYKYVYTVYKEQSITRAAQKLFISQPSLSVAIQNVEKEVGAPLFERRGGKVLPTEIGWEYIAASEEILRTENDFKRKINDIHSLRTGRISVGGTNYLSSYVLPKIVTCFSSLYPNVEVDLVEANSQALGTMVKNEEIDVVVDSFDGLSELYQGYPLIEERILLCVPSELPINKELTAYQITPELLRAGSDGIESVPPVSIERFREEGFVLLKNGNDMHNRAMRIFHSAGVTPNALFYVDQLNISYALAESGTGLCFVTDTLIKYGGIHGNLSFYRLDGEHCRRTLYVAYKSGRYCTCAMREFIETARKMIN